MMVKVVEARLDVALYNPFHPCERLFYLRQRSMATPMRSESVGAIFKRGFVNRFQYHANDFLYQFIVR